VTLRDLQRRLKELGRYPGALDGAWGRITESAVLLALRDGPDTPLRDGDFRASGARLGGVAPEAIHAFWVTEAAGAGFQDGLPKILPEPHVFSRATGGRFDRTNPDVSYPTWGERPYPATQDKRYAVLLRMVSLDVDAGFGSASWGAPQILGQNHDACGYATAFDFALAVSRDEATQLRAFEAFVNAAGILPHLRKVGRAEASWGPVALIYNGPAAARNSYAARMARNYAALGGR
jgi:hypothetical protein